MNWEPQLKWQALYAIFYAVVSSSVIAAAVWSFLGGYHPGAALLGVTALPFAIFAVMPPRNWRLIRAIAGEQVDPSLEGS